MPKIELLHIDCMSYMATLPDKAFELAIVDPPYGINYKSNFSKYSEHVTKEGLENDDDTAIVIFDKVCEVLNRKTKADSHLYFFIDWKNLVLDLKLFHFFQKKHTI